MVSVTFVLHETSSIIHQKKPDPLDFHHIEGYQDTSTWARVKGGVKMLLNFWTPGRRQLNVNSTTLFLLTLSDQGY